jgi:hypothetical protein
MPLFVTVTPGTTVTSSTTLDASTLNLLGTPSVDVTGTVDGGSLSVTNGSLQLAAIANQPASTLVGNASGSSAAVTALTSTDLAFATGTVDIGTGKVTTAKLADSSSSATGVTYAKIQHVTDARLLGRSNGSNGIPQEISVGAGLTLASGSLSNSLLRYTTSLKALPTDGNASQQVQWIAGELPSIAYRPQLVRVVLRCKTDDTGTGYVTGDEIDLQSVTMQCFLSNFPIAVYTPTVVCGITSGSLFLNVFFSAAKPGNAQWSSGSWSTSTQSGLFVLKYDGNWTQLTRLRWEVKAYLLHAPTWP